MNKKLSSVVELCGGFSSNIPEATMKVVGDPVVIYDYPINGEIGEVSKYQGLFDVLHTATENDMVLLHITTPGGSLLTAQKICAEIASAVCTVVGVVVGECASAGTLIALSCDSLDIDPDASFLFHTMSYGTEGMAPHIESYVEHSKEVMQRLCERHYTGILTEEEIKSLLRGDQLWLFGDEVKNRIDELRKKEAPEEGEEDLLDEQRLEDMSVEELEDLMDQINDVLSSKLVQDYN